MIKIFIKSSRYYTAANMIKNLVFIIHLLVLCTSAVFAQNTTNCLDDIQHTHVAGKKIITPNGTSILLLDTCDYGNRMFRFMIDHDLRTNDQDVLLPSFIIDSTMLNKIEQYLGVLLPSSKKLKTDFYRNYKNDIKLLIGSLDERTGTVYITIQLLTTSEFESEEYYAHSVFLVVGHENLKYLVLKYHDEQFALFSSYEHHI